MKKVLFTIIGIIIVVTCLSIIVDILQSIVGFAIYISIIVIVVGGAFLILRKIFRG